MGAKAASNATTAVAHGVANGVAAGANGAAMATRGVARGVRTGARAVAAVGRGIAHGANEIARGVTLACADTGSSCASLPCQPSSNSKCYNGRCVCQLGCAWIDSCAQVCDRDIGATCQVSLDCNPFRAECQRGQCVCAPGLCASNGMCGPPSQPAPGNTPPGVEMPVVPSPMVQDDEQPETPADEIAKSKLLISSYSKQLQAEERRAQFGKEQSEVDDVIADLEGAEEALEEIDDPRMARPVERLEIETNRELGLLGVARTKACRVDTGGSCDPYPCEPSRHAMCQGGACICEEGSCAVSGRCLPKVGADAVCLKFTGGTCEVLDCDPSRNAVCESDSCVCPPGTCAKYGMCVPEATQANEAADSAAPSVEAMLSKVCVTDTGGWCYGGTCDSTRLAICRHNSCVCETGSCVENGQCTPRSEGACMKYTGGTWANSQELFLLLAMAPAWLTGRLVNRGSYVWQHFCAAAV
eukprot:TRINITY_DN3642_c0_g1_i12.p1 TRINITY_DN3642_c0_g1~~TRINITY_DN3642_c0_g1_i12.p1  ORF type:complete len:554 (+),score=64.59 TRINITY_DN3642_c0_g1_i12:250-1662(+)